MFTSVCAKPKVMPDEPWRGEDSCSDKAERPCLLKSGRVLGWRGGHSACRCVRAVVGLLGPCRLGGTGTFCRLYLRV